MPTAKTDENPAILDEYQVERGRLQDLEEERRVELEEIESRITYYDLPNVNPKAALESANCFSKGFHANTGYGNLGRAYLQVLRDHEPLKDKHDALNEEFACNLSRMEEMEEKIQVLEGKAKVQESMVQGLQSRVINHKAEIDILKMNRGNGGNRVAIALAELDEDATVTFHVDRTTKNLKVGVSRPTEGKKRTQVALTIPKGDRFEHMNPDNLIAGQLLHGLSVTGEVAEKARTYHHHHPSIDGSVKTLKETVKAFQSSIQKGSGIPASILFGGKNEDE